MGVVWAALQPDFFPKSADTAGNTAQNADIEAKLRRRCEAAGVKYVGVGCGPYKAELERRRRQEMQLKRHYALQKACKRAEEKAKQTAAAEASDRPVGIMAAAVGDRQQGCCWAEAAALLGVRDEAWREGFAAAQLLAMKQSNRRVVAEPVKAEQSNRRFVAERPCRCRHRRRRRIRRRRRRRRGSRRRLRVQCLCVWLWG